MMICPETYIESLKDYSFEELIKERDRLIRDIKRYERLEKKGDRTGEEWMYRPSPEVVYQMNLDYLSALLKLIKEKYNKEQSTQVARLIGTHTKNANKIFVNSNN